MVEISQTSASSGADLGSAKPSKGKTAHVLKKLLGHLRMPSIDQEIAPDANLKAQQLFSELKSKMPGYMRTTVKLFKECLRSFPRLTCATIGVQLADSVLKVAPLYLLAQLTTLLAKREEANLTFTMAALCTCWAIGTVLNSARGMLNSRFQNKVKQLSEKQLLSAYLEKPLPTLKQEEFNQVAHAAKMSTYNTGYYLTGNIGIIGNITTCLLAGSAIIAVSPAIGGAFAFLGLAEIYLALKNVSLHTTVEQQTSKAARIANSLGWNLMSPNRAAEYKNRGVVNQELERIQILTSEVDDAHYRADKVSFGPSLAVNLVGDGVRIFLLYSLVSGVFNGRFADIGAPLQVLMMSGAFSSALSSFAGGIAAQARNYLQIGRRLALPLIGGLEKIPGINYKRLDLNAAPKVTLNNLEFKVDGNPLLNGISVNFEPGKVYGLCGDSGAGKSTLVQLLTASNYPTAGEFLINGHRIEEVDLEDWRHLFSYMPQDFLVMSGYTVGEAIRFGAARTKDPLTIQEALDLADAQFINPQTDLDTVIGSDFGGREFSGGESQRIAIARALIGKAKFLILDEPTSKLGVAHDDKIISGICAAARRTNTTVILISHRYVNLADADEVLYFENGKIVEQGTHEQLKVAGGGYAQRLYDEGKKYRS